MSFLKNNPETDKYLSLKSKALLNTARGSLFTGAGSVCLIFAGVPDVGAVSERGQSAASLAAEHALGNTLIVDGAIGSGASLLVLTCAMLGYIKTSGDDWLRAHQAQTETVQPPSGETR